MKRMSITIKKQLVTNLSKTYGKRNQQKYIVIHQTGNTSKGADAQAHANLQSNGNLRSSSWHITVDDKEAIQSYDYDVSCWHAGDGYGDGNLHGIAVEICINSDGDYVKAILNAVDVVKQLQKKFNIPTSRVKQHAHFSGKNCPSQIRSNVKGISWDDFIKKVNGVDEPKTLTTKHVIQRGDTFISIAKKYNTTPGKIMAYNPRVKATEMVVGDVIWLIPIPDAQPVEKKEPPKPAYKALDTKSLVDFLNANDMDSSYEARKVLAKKYGVKSYRGTASQNTSLLEKIKAD